MKTPAYTLARVRNNQRRHRQKRREYISSLERKLQDTLALLARAEADVRRLQAELDTQKDLVNATRMSLELSGCPPFTRDDVDHPFILPPFQQQPSQAEERPDAKLSEVPQMLAMTLHGSTAPERSWAVAAVTQHDMSPAASTAVASNFVGFVRQPIVSSLASPSLLTNKEAGPPIDYPRRSSPSAQCCSLAERHPSPADTDALLPSSPAFAPQDVTIPTDSYDTYPPSDETESTTLCSQAYILIAQQNFRGLNATTIKNWLDQGFRRAKEHDEGCRVENGLLFGLLDFISNV